ncbi:MAG: hypothetical protein DRI90_04615, partial [Deltaproteobacteria bacterium]
TPGWMSHTVVACILSLSALAGCSDKGEGGQGGGAAEPGLMDIGELTFTGAFRLPSSDFGVSNVNYAVGVLGYNVHNHSLFIVGHAHHTAVAEFPIAEGGTQEAVVDLPVSDEPLQPFVDVLSATADGNPDALDRITGLMVVDGALRTPAPQA